MKTNFLLLLALCASPGFVVVASPENDRRIEADAMASYNYRTVLENKVTATSSDGVVTLTGTVEDQGQKDIAAETAANVSGVKEVKNEIVIDPTHKEYSDSWMGIKIRSLLLVKANVSVGSTKVEVKDGVVTLSGTAENQAQKDLTGLYAMEIEGVTSVVNDIEVVAKQDAEESVAEEIDDASITAQVKSALRRHKSTRGLEILVLTTDGEVSLEGEVLNDAERSLAGKLAKDIRGVKSVTNELTVQD